jgi:hypothetical protein
MLPAVIDQGCHHRTHRMSGQMKSRRLRKRETLRVESDWYSFISDSGVEQRAASSRR